LTIFCGIFLKRICIVSDFWVEGGHLKDQEILSRITILPGVCGGRPTIRGMRITVANVLELLASAMSEQQILSEYPYLQADDIRACLTYAAKLASYHTEPLVEAP
jgi:uncharacterized protein (DUF433 family)